MASNKQVSIITVLSLTVLALAVSIGAYSVKNFLWDGRYDKYEKNEFIDATTYQAIFLTNDQIYFGHLKNVSNDYLILSDVYYVKIDEENDKNILVRLGTIEPHEPTGSMTVNKDQVLFWENLRPDSQVIKKIESM